MYVTTPSSAAAKLTVTNKQEIRRNDRSDSSQYERPNVFHLIRVGRPRHLEQGEMLLGKIKVVTKKTIACQLIYVEFRGLAQVDFNVASTTMVDEVQNFHKEWEFFNHKIPVFLHENRGYNFLQPGQYQFYYKCRVPIGGPCSFYSEIASVSYRLKAVLVRNDITDDIFSDNEIVYYVKGYKDLNPYDGGRIGVWQQRSTSVGGFLGFFRGKLEVKAKTDRRAYIPGEKIHLKIQLRNTTWRNCIFRYDLIQKTKMWGDHYFWRSDEWGSRSQHEKLIIEAGRERTIKAGDSLDLSDTIIIPKCLEPSYLGMTAGDYINELINLEYMLRFEIYIPLSTDLVMDAPIIIGTEPYTFLPPPPRPPESPKISPPASSTSTLPPTTATVQPESVKEEKLPPLVVNFGEHYEPLKLPRFHPLNRDFQKLFPRSYGREGQLDPFLLNLYPDASKILGEDGGQGRRKGDKCRCTCRKKRHRSKCRKAHPDYHSTESQGVPRETVDYARNTPVEECTFASWLTASSIEEHEGDPSKKANLLFAAMKEYGIIS